jgi:hypothetical protein
MSIVISVNFGKRLARATIACGLLVPTLLESGVPQTARPEIVRISPTGGPEGSRVEISGRNLQDATAVLFGTTSSAFSAISSEELIALIPHKSPTSIITVVTSRGRASSPFPFAVANDPRVPDEVSYKAGYVNPVPLPREFRSAMLWGIAIADTRASGHQSAEVEIAWTQLVCRADGKDVILNEDSGVIRGGLYRRQPWFGSNQPDPMPMTRDVKNHATVLAVGQRPDRVWHFWSGSPRAPLPAGNLEGCTVKARVRISPGALLQMGMDYWRNATVDFGLGGNNREAGASNWYFPSDQWQEAIFTDIGGPQF